MSYNNMRKKSSTILLFGSIHALVKQSKETLYQAINTTLVETYFHVGRLIIEFEQSGQVRAGYADKTLKSISSRLTKVFGKGFSVDNLENMRKFYTEYRDSYAQFLGKKQKS